MTLIIYFRGHTPYCDGMLERLLGDLQKRALAERWTRQELATAIHAVVYLPIKQAVQSVFPWPGCRRIVKSILTAFEKDPQKRRLPHLPESFPSHPAPGTGGHGGGGGEGGHGHAPGPDGGSGGSDGSGTSSGGGGAAAGGGARRGGGGGRGGGARPPISSRTPTPFSSAAVDKAASRGELALKALRAGLSEVHRREQQAKSKATTALPPGAKASWDHGRLDGVIREALWGE
jgi:hypothetical protein